MYPSEYLNAADLNGKDAKVTIERIDLEDVPGVDGAKKRKPVLHFKGAKKRFVLPKTCAKAIANEFGPNTDQWIGKAITLYPTTCMAFGQQVECVRVR
jgi:hypothetical protein